MNLQQLLESYGYIVGPRDPNMNTNTAGEFMVSEPYPPGYTQESGAGGIWCMVGDELEELMTAAIDNFDLEAEPAPTYAQLSKALRWIVNNPHAHPENVVAVAREALGW